jgi:glutamine amidotransferase
MQTVGERSHLEVAIIDYQMSNLFSVKHACEHAGLKPVITCDRKVIMNSDAAILPGVGAFGEAMDNLRRLDLIGSIKDFIDMGKPFLGICLGIQLLLSESEEFGNHKGLNVIEGVVVRFPNKNREGRRVKVPQVGWNKIFRPKFASEEYWENSPLRGIRDGELMYFVHSYYVIPANQSYVLTRTNYDGIDFCSSVMRDNVFAFQFHPEKSGVMGLKIYRNLASTLRNLKEAWSWEKS